MKKYKYFLPEVAVIAFAILVRLIHLNGSFWLDEAAQAIESARPLTEQLNIASDFQPPLFHLLVHFWYQFGVSEWWLRLTSFIPGLITIWLTIMIGKKLFSRDVGLTAGMLLASSQFHLFYSQELRPYSLAACFALMAFWGWYKLMNSSKKNSYILLISGLAGLYTMYVFPVFLLTLLLATILFYPQKIRHLLFHFGFFIVGFLPWLPSFVEQLTIGTHFAGQSQIWSNVVSPPLYKMIPLVFAKFMIGRINLEVNPFFITVVIALFIFLGKASFATIRKKQGLLTGLMFIGPIIFAFLISIFVPVLDPKRILFALPFMYLLLAAGISKKLNSIAILIVFLTVNMLSLQSYANDPDNQREPWRLAVTEIESQAKTGDVALFIFNGPFAPWTYYNHHKLEEVSTTNPADPQLKAKIIEASELGKNIYLFEYLRVLFDPNNQVVALLENTGYEQQGYFQYPGIGKIYLYTNQLNAAKYIGTLY